MYKSIMSDIVELVPDINVKFHTRFLHQPRLEFNQTYRPIADL